MFHLTNLKVEGIGIKIQRLVIVIEMQVHTVGGKVHNHGLHDLDYHIALSQAKAPVGVLYDQ